MLIALQRPVQLTNTNIPNNSESTWDKSTSYNEGDIVQYENYIYKALTANSNVEPDTDPTIWFKVGPTNKWAAFDGWTDTSTILNDDITYEFKTSDIDVIAFFDLYATSIKVELINNVDNSTIFLNTYDLEIYNVSDWWEWTYNTSFYKKDLAVFLPLVYDGTLKVTIYNRDGTTQISNIAYGRSENLGASLYGTTVSRRTTINKTRSPDGRLYTSIGNGYKKITVPVMIDTKLVDEVVRRLDEIDGIPTLFIGDEREGGFESLLVYGFFRDLDVPISLVKSRYEIEIEGVG